MLLKVNASGLTSSWLMVRKPSLMVGLMNKSKMRQLNSQFQKTPKVCVLNKTKRSLKLKRSHHQACMDLRQRATTILR